MKRKTCRSLHVMTGETEPRSAMTNTYECKRVSVASLFVIKNGKKALINGFGSAIMSPVLGISNCQVFETMEG